jgi:hypothetical protein
MVNAAVIVSWVGLALLLPLLFLAQRRIRRTKGRVLRFHLYYAGFVALGLLAIPHSIKYTVYSPLTVTVVGTVFAIYESIRAVCTPGGEDDKSWLQYWIAYSFLTFTTEWVNKKVERDENVRIHWYEFEFFFFLWLLLPWTDGACLMYDYVTYPLTKTWIAKVEKRMNHWMSNIVSTVVSASHLWILWAVFLFFPPTLKRFVTVGVGVVYPVIASIVAVGTTNTYDDDTFWLTYWSCYGCLYLIMDFLETWVGRVPGFYTVVLFSSVYLMLPIMQGAEKVFRKILVPLAGLQELLLVRDAMGIKKEMMKSLTPAQRKAVKQEIAASFGKDDDDDDEENDPLINYGYGGNNSTTNNNTANNVNETTGLV